MPDNYAGIYLFMKTNQETGYATELNTTGTMVKEQWVHLKKSILVQPHIDKLNIRIDNRYAGKVWFDDVRVLKGNSAKTEIVEENNYYPFGGKHQGYNNVVNSTNPALKYKFGGKEYQDELGLNWYDITARNYDPYLGRWMNIDPLAEQMRRHSPYNYAFDNPIYFIDPDGMMPYGSIDPPISGEGIARAVESKINEIGNSIKKGWNSFTSLFRSSTSRDRRVNTSGEGIRIWGNNKTNEGSTQDNGESKGSLETDDIPGAPGGHKGAKGNVVKAFKGGMKDTGKVEGFFETGNEIADNASDDNKGGSVDNQNGKEPDTTVTAAFADKIERTDGTAIFSSTKDSTVTIKKSDVSSFNASAQQSRDAQKEKVQEMLDERFK
jgi:RHS repeat-associated protein